MPYIPVMVFFQKTLSFPDRCEKEGLIFIGPTAEQQRLLGDKVSARTAAIKAGVPVVPGTDEPVDNEEDAFRFAKSAGYPIIIKAAAGGGGRGMRVANNHKELVEGLSSAKSEAKAAFGMIQCSLKSICSGPNILRYRLWGTVMAI